MKKAFLFPGQGSQKVGMVHDLYTRYDAVKKLIGEADERLGFSISKLMFEGPDDELMKTEFTQPAILTASVAVWTVLKEHGVTPDVVAGHREIHAGSCSSGRRRHGGHYCAEAGNY